MCLCVFVCASVCEYACVCVQVRVCVRVYILCGSMSVSVHDNIKLLCNNIMGCYA